MPWRTAADRGNPIELRARDNLRNQAHDARITIHLKRVWAALQNRTRRRPWRDTFFYIFFLSVMFGPMLAVYVRQHSLGNDAPAAA
jgi:hypothetical protein